MIPISRRTMLAAGVATGLGVAVAGTLTAVFNGESGGAGGTGGAGGGGSSPRGAGYGPLVRATTGVTALWTSDDGGFYDATTIFPDHVSARITAIAFSMCCRSVRSSISW